VNYNFSIKWNADKTDFKMRILAFCIEVF